MLVREHRYTFYMFTYAEGDPLSGRRHTKLVTVVMRDPSEIVAHLSPAAGTPIPTGLCFSSAVHTGSSSWLETLSFLLGVRNTIRLLLFYNLYAERSEFLHSRDTPRTGEGRERGGHVSLVFAVHPGLISAPPLPSGAPLGTPNVFYPSFSSCPMGAIRLLLRKQPG